MYYTSLIPCQLTQARPHNVVNFNDVANYKMQIYLTDQYK